MARKPTGGKHGRPKKELDIKKFEALCKMHCTEPEIASVLEMDTVTLERRVKEQYGDVFSVILKKLSQGGKASLRRTQFKLAEKNVAMAIWLGKQYLGQVDKQEIDQNVKAEITEVKHTIIDPNGNK